MKSKILIPIIAILTILAGFLAFSPQKNQESIQYPIQKTQNSNSENQKNELNNKALPGEELPVGGTNLEENDEFVYNSVDNQHETRDMDHETTSYTTTANNETMEQWDNETDHITFIVEDRTYPQPYRKNETLHEFMMNLSAQSAQPFYFETKEYPGMGFFVTSINGKSEDKKNNLYWFYYINNNSATEGISTYIIQKGDIIEWKYEEATF